MSALHDRAELGRDATRPSASGWPRLHTTSGAPATSTAAVPTAIIASGPDAKRAATATMATAAATTRNRLGRLVTAPG